MITKNNHHPAKRDERDAHARFLDAKISVTFIESRQWQADLVRRSLIFDSRRCVRVSPRLAAAHTVSSWSINPSSVQAAPKSGERSTQRQTAFGYHAICRGLSNSGRLFRGLPIFLYEREQLLVHLAFQSGAHAVRGAFINNEFSVLDNFR
jgi:hypothetical protein